MRNSNAQGLGRKDIYIEQLKLLFFLSFWQHFKNNHRVFIHQIGIYTKISDKLFFHVSVSTKNILKISMGIIANGPSQGKITANEVGHLTHIFGALKLNSLKNSAKTK